MKKRQEWQRKRRDGKEGKKERKELKQGAGRSKTERDLDEKWKKGWMRG